MSSDHIDTPLSPSNILSAGDPPDDTPAAPPPETTSTTPPTSPHRRRNSVPIPLAFPPLFQTNGSSVSLIHSTAEGRPVPVDHTTAADRTSALRHLNSHFPSSPSRHRYAKSTGAQSTTYSQPVIVRTYPGPRHDPSSPPSGHRSHHHHHHHHSDGPSRPSPPSAPSAIHRIIPFASSDGPRLRGGMLSSLSRSRKRDEAHLPPVESFTFRSIMNDAQANITTDLDRIAEICARSRYSLSNQYEVHKAPHGSGEAFLSSPPPPPDTKSGPTLQAVPSSADDVGSGGERGTKRRRRRRSVAVGTLETIMSSSRSSDEDRSKKKSAAEIADEVRGRAAARRSGDSSPVSSSDGQGQGERAEGGEQPTLKRRMSSLANVIVDAEGRAGHVGDRGLVSAPAEPETCTDVDVAGDSGDAESSRRGILQSLSSWIWRGAGSHAEGSLREVLRSDGKGKGVER
ncbi:uncharacterized protein DNG_01138 [Cephalotrichum gorgonifer]|uniref:Uncharacterized protein n=1 Tax=Cephalotrichum gorgonifer TaxID=2041049 RepID=A0AAE8MQA7_9PEZI|nr:uncharacterized protein DNG_01138 [Cephalotrichum gorgonifer]